MGAFGSNSLEHPEDDDRKELRRRFHGELEALDDEFVATALMVADALPRLTTAFFAADTSSIDDARSMAQRVYDRCRAIEDDGFRLLAIQAPVAGELRRLVALLRLATDVDRSASLLKHVSETLQYFDPAVLPEELRRTIRELAQRTTEVFRRGVEAWRQRDALAVVEVDQLDEGVDRLQEIIMESATSLGARDELLLLGLITRYFERIADHGVALAEDTVFVVTGERMHVG